MSDNKHAIIIINSNGKYLQYFDERWNSFLFPNCKINTDKHIDEIKNYLTEKCNIQCNNIDIAFIEDKIHSKFSESAQKMKEYHHYFYVAKNIEEFDKIDNNTTINGIKFLWFSMKELENDKRIQKVNNDIVNFIKQMKI